MNVISKLNDDSLVQGYCNHCMELLQVNQNSCTGSAMEQIIKCISSVVEFKLNISRFIHNTENNISLLWNNTNFFKKT